MFWVVHLHNHTLKLFRKIKIIHFRLFDNNIISLQNEFRQANENSKFIADFGFVNGYKNNNRSHIFAEYNSNLNLNKFENSNLSFQFECIKRHILKSF